MCSGRFARLRAGGQLNGLVPPVGAPALWLEYVIVAANGGIARAKRLAHSLRALFAAASCAPLST